ncbi:efflux RND transporter periplasmic adaptor subunit [bacterium]|mgnify:CR=1 FL=1|jgi:cobalt-zinc-cadmium efflux system membrane fusion protein|nr:efflux RND transporter periplasmic adaptor subunit [bacterium]
MKINIKSVFLLLTLGLLIASCGGGDDHAGHDHGESGHEEHGDEHEEEVHFSEQQFASLNMKIDSLRYRNINSYVQANGQLEVPPQNEAIVTAVIGSNVKSIKVIEGDKIKKGQVLAYLSHPDLISVQTEYASNWNQLAYLKEEYERKKKLYEDNVGSGKEYQKSKSAYFSMKSQVSGDESKLRLLGISPKKIQEGTIYDQVAVTSPISGHIRTVEVKTGQFVQPEKELFEIVNIEHIHADLMVFEKDMHKVKEGQRVTFTTESAPGKELEATIYSVGKAFEQDPKAIHLHAEIENKQGLLIPGMYINGRIIAEDVKTYALPESAVVREGDKYFIFTAKKEKDNGEIEWAFQPVEVNVGGIDNGWIEIKLLQELSIGTQLAYNNAYYIMAEMKKGEAEHTH